MSIVIYGGIKPGVWVGLPEKGATEVTDIGITSNLGLKIDAGQKVTVSPEGTLEHSTKVGWMGGGKIGLNVALDEKKKTTVGTYIEAGKILGNEKSEFVGTTYFGTGVSVGTELVSMNLGIRRFWDRADMASDGSKGRPTWSLGFGVSFSGTIKRDEVA